MDAAQTPRRRRADKDGRDVTLTFVAIIIETRFRGPALSGNGGYTAGLLAAAVGSTGEPSPVEVTLRKPPPLGTPLAVVREGDLLKLCAAEVLIAEATPTSLSVEPPAPVSFEEAKAAEADYAGLVEHPFPGCFSCGTERTDGLGLRPGPVRGRSVVACTWVVPPDLTEPEFAWAALDCPSGWSTITPGRPMVLGRITAHVTAPLVAGGRYVIVGWTLSQDERKAQAGSALYDESGAVLGVARSTWITVNPATLQG